MNLRIALIIPTFPPIVGGLERLSYLIARGLAEQNFSVTVITYSAYSVDGERRRVVDINQRLRIRRYVRVSFQEGLKVSVGLLRDLLTMSVDLYYLVSYVPSYLLLSSIFAARLRGIPLVYQPIFQPDRPVFQKRKRKLTSSLFDFGFGPTLMLKHADSILALTAYEASLYKKYVPYYKINTIPEPVDLRSVYRPSAAEEEEIRQRLGLKKCEKIILSVGRIVWNKGFDILIKAVPYVLGKYDNIRGVIAGPPTKHAVYLNKLIQRKNLGSHMSLSGRLTDAQLAALYSISTLVVCSSRYEAFFRVPLEAWAYKKAVVCTDHPVSRELIQDGENGLLFKLGDSQMLAEQLIYLLDNKAIRDQMGLKGYLKLIANYTADIVIPKIAQTCHKVVHSQSGNSSSRRSSRKAML